MKFKIVWRYKKIKRKKRRKVASPQYILHKTAALEFARARMLHFNAFYHFPVNNIAIKNQKTRWGSCSKKGNLNFNYRLVLLPTHLADYIIVHELCHLKEFNHSPAFWALVAQTIPDYQKIRKEFKGVRMQ